MSAFQMVCNVSPEMDRVITYSNTFESAAFIEVAQHSLRGNKSLLATSVWNTKPPRGQVLRPLPRPSFLTGFVSFEPARLKQRRPLPFTACHITFRKHEFTTPHCCLWKHSDKGETETQKRQSSRGQRLKQIKFANRMVDKLVVKKSLNSC